MQPIYTQSFNFTLATRSNAMHVYYNCGLRRKLAAQREAA